MKIGLTGTSSSGKTTLALRLANYFKFDLVHEIARNYPHDFLQFEEIQYNILFDQIRAEMFANKNVITDRTVIDNYQYIIKSHKPRMYVLNLIRSWTQTYDIIFLCKKLPFVDDGFRIDYDIENKLIFFMQNNLVEYEILEGNQEERFERAKKIIELELYV